MARHTLLLGLALLAVLAAAAWFLHDDPQPADGTGSVATAPRDDAATEVAIVAPAGSPEPTPLPPAEARAAEAAPPPPEQVQPVLPEAPLLVEVVYEEGANPVVGAHVRVTSMDSLSGGVLSTETARTDRAGLAELTSLLGTLHVSVWTDAHEYGKATLQHNGGRELLRVRVEVERLASVAGVVRDPDGRPIAGARVRSVISRDVDIPPVSSDAQGRFEFHDWPVGTMSVLSFDAAGHGQEGITLIVEDDGRWCLVGASGELEWRGGVGAFVEVVLVPEGTIAGTLLDASGRPVTDGRIRASGVAESSAQILLSDDAEAVTDANGAFALAGLRPDVAHLVLCDAPGEGVALRSTDGSAGHVDLGPITLSGAARVTGRFVDRWDRPLGGALLELVLPNVVSLVPGEVDEAPFFGNPRRLIASGHASEQGRIELGGPRVHGMRLSVRMGLHTLWEAPIDLTDGDLDLGVVRLDTEVKTLDGRLLTSAGRPARLDVIDHGGRLWARVESAPDGSFQFVTLDGVPPRVTIVQRSDEDLPLHRWTRDTESFPVLLAPE